MAEVKVQITGENRDFIKKVDESKKKTRELANQVSGKGSVGTNNIFSKLTKSAGALGKVVAGGLGISAATAGFKLFGAVVDQTMRNARRQAELTGAAISSALNETVQFTGAGQTFSIDSREQAVELGRFYREELRRVGSDLERNFGPFINLDLFSGGLEKALQAGALAGFGQDRLNVLRTLILERDVLQEQVDKYTALELKLTTNSKAVKTLGDRFGFVTDQAKEAADAAAKASADAARFAANAPVPNFGGPVSPQDTPTLAGFLAQNTPTQLANSLPSARGRSFDEVVDTGQIAELSRIINDSGIVPFQKARAEIELYQSALQAMVAQGIAPTDPAFIQMQANLEGAEQRFGKVRAGIGIIQESLNGFADIATDAFDRFVLGADNAVSAGERLKNIGRSLFSSVLRAGVGVGISALTGNPIGFGAALGNVLGVVGSSAAPARTDAPSLSLAPASAGGGGFALETEIRGDAIAVVLRESQVARAGRGGAI